jgi:hypothetical protein
VAGAGRGSFTEGGELGGDLPVRASTLDRMLGPSFYRAAFAAFDYYCQKYIHRHAHHTQIGTLTPGRTHVHLSHAVIGKHHSLLLVAPDLFASLSEYRTSLLCFYQMYRVAKGDPHDIVGGKKNKERNRRLIPSWPRPSRHPSLKPSAPAILSNSSTRRPMSTQYPSTPSSPSH